MKLKELLKLPSTKPKLLKRALARRPVQPNAIRAAYYRAIKTRVLGTLRALLTERVVKRAAPILSRFRQDGPTDELDALFDDVERDFFNVVWTKPNVKRLSLEYAGSLERLHRKTLNDRLRPAVGIDVFGNEPWLYGKLEEFTAQNTALIRNMASDTINQINREVVRLAPTGLRAESMAKIISERLGVADSRAALIARDQAGKFFGELDRTRQTDLGITEYIWNTVNDGRVRPEHEERQGQTFKWSDPPEDGHPGQAVNCRCYAEPKLPGE